MLAIESGADGVVLVSGRLDAAQCPAAQTYLDALNGVVTLDCGKLEYISSAGLGAFVGVVADLRAKGGDILFVGLNRKVSKIFDLLGIKRIFKVFKDEGEALGEAVGSEA